MKTWVKRGLARVAPAVTAPGTRVLLYHAIDGPDPMDRLELRVRPETFRAHMEYLRSREYLVVPLRDLLAGAGSGDSPGVVITFDDGYRSQLDAAAILEEFGFPATFFVVTGFLDREPARAHYWEGWEHMRWADLKALAGCGFEIGAHSASHPRLTGCSANDLRLEVQGARSCLEDHLGQPVKSFSYPYGGYDARVRRAVEEAGYRLACTSVGGTNRSPWRPFEVRRTEITGVDGLREFEWKLLGKYDWLQHWQRWRTRHA